jgi:hypothetical protein
MWYETDTTARGTRIRYSVIFSNEDGGTPADRLLATWGRLTDIEYVLGIEFDQEGRVLEATYQGPDHKILPYRGIVPGRHPELWVVTDNNMVSDRGSTQPTFAPVPIPFDLSATSREAVMERATLDLRGQFAGGLPRAPGGQEAEAGLASHLRSAALRLRRGLRGDEGRGPHLRSRRRWAGRPPWSESDAGQKDYRIIRQASEFPNGCFRGAAALPADVGDAPLRALRFRRLHETDARRRAADPSPEAPPPPSSA